MHWGMWMSKKPNDVFTYYMLWQPCTYILLESFFLSKLDASPCLLLLRCFTLKGEVHGPAHPCHVHPDLS